MVVGLLSFFTVITERKDYSYTSRSNVYKKESELYMRIAICDDDPPFRQDLKKLVLEYKLQKRIAIDFIEFETGDQMINSNDIFDIAFIDYQMPGIDGLEAAKKLRQKNCICCIVFITSYPQFMIDSFEVQPFRFLIKPIDKNKLYQAMNDYIKQQKSLNPIVIVEYGEQITINSQQIIYLEAAGKNCIIRTTENVYRSSKTLSQIQALLPEHCFFRIHKSYLVNLYCISKYYDSIITLTNGEKVVVGRNNIANFKKAYRDFVKNYYIRF